MSAITDADRERGALFELVERAYAEGGPVAEKLRDKCRWEAMSPVAVLEEWPDIREECEALLGRIDGTPETDKVLCDLCRDSKDGCVRALIAHAKKLERRLNRQKDKRRIK